MLLATDVLELQKIMKPGDCSFTRLRGCYVSNEKEKVTRINERFLNLQDDEFYKYLDIAKATLSKKIEDCMLSMEFTEEEKAFGPAKHLLTQAVGSELKDETIVDALFDRIIEEFPYIGNYLILLYADVYDIPRVATDGADQDESEDVYAYILCAICPVTLTAAGLEYNPKSNRIGPRERDWVVAQKPVAGFLYPSFEERTVEADKIMFYTARPEEPPHTFMERGLGCEPVKTATEIREEFEHLFFTATESQDMKTDFVIAVNEKLNVMAIESTNPQKTLSKAELRDICLAAGIPEMYVQRIVKGFAEEFTQEPKISHLLNTRAVKAGAEKEKKRKLTDMMREAVDVIEKNAGEETELTYNMKNAIGQYR